MWERATRRSRRGLTRYVPHLISNPHQLMTTTTIRGRRVPNAVAPPPSPSAPTLLSRRHQGHITITTVTPPPRHLTTREQRRARGDDNGVHVVTNSPRPDRATWSPRPSKPPPPPSSSSRRAAMSPQRQHHHHLHHLLLLLRVTASISWWAKRVTSRAGVGRLDSIRTSGGGGGGDTAARNRLYPLYIPTLHPSKLG